MVLNRMNSSINLDKYLAFMLEETKTNAGMKNPEIHALMMGRMMCVSAMIDSQWVSGKTFYKLLDILAKIYAEQEFLREAIQLICIKVLKSSSANIALFDKIVSDLKMLSEAKALSSSADLSLFLCLRDIYLTKFQGQSKEHDKLMCTDIISNKKNLASIAQQIRL